MTPKSISVVLFLGMLVLANGQVTYNETTGAYTCSSASGAYCGGSSLSTNIIIRCSNFVGQPANCNDNLSGISPLGVKSAATCYQSSATSGDAVCSFNGVGYPEDVAAFPICSAPPVVSATPVLSFNASRPTVAFRTGPLLTPSLPSSSSITTATSTTTSGSDSTPASTEAPLSTRTTTTTIAGTALRTSVDASESNVAPTPSQNTNSSARTKVSLPQFLLSLLGIVAWLFAEGI